MTALLAFGAGVLFALGLGVSGMTQPAKVLGFLDVTGAWDPSLALVMVGAIGVGFVSLRLTAGWARPWCAPRFNLPTQRAVDARLVAGAAIFGVGWGLAGVCPGPALVAVASGPGALVLTLGMLVGVLIHEVGQRARARAAAVGTEPAE